jgi:hypothetical protein
VNSFSTFAAIALADLGELGVGNSCESGDLGCLSSLFKALGDSTSEAWQLTEVAWASRKLEWWKREYRSLFANHISCTDYYSLLCEILGTNLSKSGFDSFFSSKGSD